ncbi:MAG: hypothetical protein U5R31_11655 [Acidimicrobiia bacterium]|nr:hypothetical protein [Acidimicrobiia bacterium]
MTPRPSRGEPDEVRSGALDGDRARLAEVEAWLLGTDVDEDVPTDLTGMGHPTGPDAPTIDEPHDGPAVTGPSAVADTGDDPADPPPNGGEDGLL